VSLLFLLDQDIDVAVGKVVRRAGHRCLSAGEIGLATASDEAVSIWADNHKAIVFTHDKEFIKRRRKHTFGRHIQLICNEEDAAEIVGTYLAEIVVKLDGHDSAVLQVSRDLGVRYYAGKWA
jgi:predicted nuclease of predicted toxin-antitoxin system